jgi:poly-gamma-glutamate capsule biosynthesis protein CapA/YwtB (metallophosphatase superfamily)
LFLYPLFSLTHEAQRKKLSKKETPRKISPRARGDQRSARWIGGRFLKKATEKLLICFALAVANSLINQNLK